MKIMKKLLVIIVICIFVGIGGAALLANNQELRSSLNPQTTEISDETENSQEENTAPSSNNETNESEQELTIYGEYVTVEGAVSTSPTGVQLNEDGTGTFYFSDETTIAFTWNSDPEQLSKVSPLENAPEGTTEIAIQTLDGPYVYDLLYAYIDESEAPHALLVMPDQFVGASGSFPSITFSQDHNWDGDTSIYEGKEVY